MVALERAKEIYLRGDTNPKMLSSEEQAMFDLTNKFMCDFSRLMEAQHSTQTDSTALSVTKAISEDETNHSSMAVSQKDAEEQDCQDDHLGKRILEPWDFDFQEYSGIQSLKKNASFEGETIFPGLMGESTLNFGEETEINFQFSLDNDINTF